VDDDRRLAEAAQDQRASEVGRRAVVDLGGGGEASERGGFQPDVEIA
jgi:hypothetical protein